MKISLGTTSQNKLKILEEILKDRKIQHEIFPQNSSSEISDQPLSLNETLRGAQNRARNCYDEKFDFSVGMEGGLIDIDELYSLVCIVSFFDGKNFFTGISNFYPLPKTVSNAVKEGDELGILIRDFYQQNPSTAIADLVSRKPAFSEAIIRAIEQIKN